MARRLARAVASGTTGRGDAPSRGFARGVLETLGIIGGFVAAGLGWAAALEAGGADPALPAVYPSAVPPEVPAPAGPADLPDAAPEGPLWLVDGYNVIGVALLAGRSREGWWRSERRRELVERAAGFDDPTAHVWVVFDGERPPTVAAEPPTVAAEPPTVAAEPPTVAAEPPTVAAEPRAQVVFAPSADDWLLRRLRAMRDPTRVTVVTGDRRLAARARHRGASVVTPRAFLVRCPAGPCSS